MKYAVYLTEDPACDYAIACGQKLVFLPDAINTMEKAIAHVRQTDGPGSLQQYWYDDPDDWTIKNCTILEISDSQQINLESWLKARIHKQEEENERQLYERLKVKFENQAE